MNSSPKMPPPIEDDEAERLALEAAVAKARAEARPGVPHEKVRVDMLHEIERLNRKIAALAKR